MSKLPMNLNAINAIQGTAGENVPPAAQWTQGIQIVYNNSTILDDWDEKVDGPKPAVGEFWLGQKNGKPLGKVFVAVPIAIRDHALQTKGGETTAESFNGCKCCASTQRSTSPPTNEEEKIFHSIASAPKQQDKKLNRWGSDVLLWIPEHKLFAQIFLHSTNRQCIGAYQANFGKFCKIKSYTPPSSQYTWYLAECRPVMDVSTLDPQKETFLPTEEATVEEVTKFKNPTPRGEGRTNSSGVDGRPR